MRNITYLSGHRCLVSPTFPGFSELISFGNGVVNDFKMNCHLSNVEIKGFKYPVGSRNIGSASFINDQRRAVWSSGHRPSKRFVAYIENMHEISTKKVRWLPGRTEEYQVPVVLEEVEQ
ncbi:hypothetical protein J6590_064237 [Homalodisca vitripennis]|nr:hypothetical protein J6590_064237 [Homalodisca vitripennis]